MFINIVISKIIEKFVERAVNIAAESGKKFIADGNKESLQEKLNIHLIEVVNWFERMHFFLLTQPLLIEKSTIELEMHTEIRRLGGAKNSSNLLTEDQIINDSENYLILGQPGAGKTTTLKRLVKKLFQENESIGAYPIVIRLAELKESSSLHEFICDKIGLEYAVTNEKEFIDKIINQKPVKAEIYIKKTRIGSKLIEMALPEFLNNTQAYLFLDGLDEVRNNKANVISEIKSITAKTSSCKIILTSRTAEYKLNFEGFTICEINPLNEPQVLQIISKYFDNEASNFYSMVASKPYKDMVNRPLFLLFLIIIFKKGGSLPNQSCEIYRRIVSLVIRDWDNERLVTRISGYAGFDTERKLDFLCEISFHLTYKYKVKVFTRDTIAEIYLMICEKYELPEASMDDVIREIESHNGILSLAGPGMYEFSHLSIQEYLCAEYLVKIPLSRTIEYFIQYPEIIAITISLSREPDQWLASTITSFEMWEHNHSIKDKTYKEIIYKLLNRILIEKPIFNVSKELGYAALYLLFKLSKDSEIYPVLSNFISQKNVLDSLSISLQEYRIDKKKEFYHFEKSIHSSNRTDTKAPLNGFVSLAVLDGLILAGLKTHSIHFREK